ncbi:MAG: 4-hydroxy-3-methylbut-2-enyl diphosphate reductase [Treponema sp.]|nr:4-hydroxy-3-methylbut-2-enyl diphosphate reductase [Treponema sp.]
MEIKRAQVLGFCFGVRRAVELADTALKNYSNKKVYSLGPLIHNEAALQKLSDQGLQIVEENQISELPEDSVVIIRAHGVAPSVIEKLKEKKSIIIDATCPRVKASQKMVERYTSEKDFVILTGDKNHGEVKGIAGYAGENFLQLQNSQEAEELNLDTLVDKNFILLSQTTYSEKEFSDIEKILKDKVKNITVMNTICPATKERQEALVTLCKEVDGILVIGGKNSANTKRLFQTAERNCKYAAHIQTSEDIPQVFYSLKKVGITAGASTPDELIESVESSLS